MVLACLQHKHQLNYLHFLELHLRNQELLHQVWYLILLLCDGSRTVNAIVGALETKFNTSGLEADVRSMLQEAARRNWLDA